MTKFFAAIIMLFAITIAVFTGKMVENYDMTEQIRLEEEVKKQAEFEALQLRLTEEAEAEQKQYNEDLEYLAKVMYCEAGAEIIDDETQLLFGAVVLNRVTSPEFPNTIKEVALQPKQYTPEYWKEPDERTYRNARILLDGYDTGMPKTVVFQANFEQGSSVWKTLHWNGWGTTYFCHSNKMHLYTTEATKETDGA